MQIFPSFSQEKQNVCKIIFAGILTSSSQYSYQEWLRNVFKLYLRKIISGKISWEIQSQSETAKYFKCIVNSFVSPFSNCAISNFVLTRPRVLDAEKHQTNFIKKPSSIGLINILVLKKVNSRGSLKDWLALIQDKKIGSTFEFTFLFLWYFTFHKNRYGGLPQKMLQRK